MRTCVNCGDMATKVWRIDIDTNGIAMCDKCEDVVTLDIITANLNGTKGWDKFGKKYSKIEKELNKKKRKNEKRTKRNTETD
jgi:hypothetical protein